MGRGWTIKGEFNLPKEAQVEIGTQVFPPPSDEEVSGLLDQLEDSMNNIDVVLGYNATLKARFGDEFVEYLHQLSEGMHYIVLEGRRPGPPPGAPAPEFGSPTEDLDALEGPGEIGVTEELEELEGGGLTEAAQLRTASINAQESTLLINDAVTDLEFQVGSTIRPIKSRLRALGKNTDAVDNLNDSIELARNSINSIADSLGDSV